MSPRDAALLAAARQRLLESRRARDAGLHSLAVSGAYYAILYAARSALSSRDLTAKTHSGTWHLFHRTFVRSGAFDASLASAAAAAQDAREDVDYDAVGASPEDADRTLALAGDFLAAVERLLD